MGRFTHHRRPLLRHPREAGSGRTMAISRRTFLASPAALLVDRGVRPAAFERTGCSASPTSISPGADHHHGLVEPAQRRRDPRLLLRGRLLVAGSRRTPAGPYVQRDGLTNPDNFVGAPPGDDAAERPGAGAGRGLDAHAASGATPTHAATPPAGVVRRRGDAHEPAPALRAGDPRAASPAAASASSTRFTSSRWRAPSRCSRARRRCCPRPTPRASRDWFSRVPRRG